MNQVNDTVSVFVYVMISQCQHKGSFSKVDNSPKQKKQGSHSNMCSFKKLFHFVFFRGLKTTNYMVSCAIMLSFFGFFFRGLRTTNYMMSCVILLSYFVLFQGFKNHKLHDVLCDPGTADMTADVDFSFFRHLCLSTKASRWN